MRLDANCVRALCIEGVHMIGFEIVWDVDSVKPWRSGKVDKALLSAAKAAGGDAIRKSRTLAKREIRKRKTIKDHRLHKALFLTYPFKTEKLNDLVWKLKFSDKPFPLAYFKHRQLKAAGKGRKKRNAGIQVEVNVGEPEVLRHAFLAKMRSGFLNVFQRVGKKRLPIEPLFSSRVSDVANDAGFMPLVQGRAKAEFEDTFHRVFALRMGSI
jgi:hypothetical protein